MNVLIVDDDVVDRRILIEALSQTDKAMCIEEASTAKQALLMVTQKDYDAILLDYILPDKDGIEVLRILRSGPHAQTAILIISQYEKEELTELIFKEGAQDYLLKHEVTSRNLVRAVKQAQQRYQLESLVNNSHEEMKELAERDELTGLANRRAFEMMLQATINRAHRGHDGLAVLFLDLDKFKNINDMLGHDIGDQLLIAVAKQLNEVVRESDLLARLGGDEFVILLQDMDHDEQAAKLAERIIKSLKEPFVIQGNELRISASIGISIYGPTANTAAELMKFADIAMYRAKEDGRNRSHFYSDELHRAVHERMELEYDIKHAIENRQFRIYYQSQIDTVSGNIIGVEALLRWEHPRRGTLLPEAFLALAKELGLMAEIDSWVLENACKQMQAWQPAIDNLKQPVKLAVNVSASQLQSETFIQTMEDTIKNYGISSELLDVEITEKALITEPLHAAEVLHHIAGMGITVSLDDFGTGFSSFEHLKLFPINTVKIDRAFVTCIGQDESQDRLLVAIICFAQALDLKIIAEGIETTQQAEFCSDHGCTLLQGFLYSKPLPASEFSAVHLSG